MTVASRVTFSPALLTEVRSLRFKDEIFNGRVQAEGFTIDGPTSRDLDDAIWFESDGNDFKLHVSIADVDSIVQANSEIDKEACKRVFTRYYGSWNDPMIPHELSENLLSLLENQMRPTLTVSVPISRDMKIGKAEIKKTTLKSLKRFNYGDVDSILKSKQGDSYELLKGYDVIAQALLASRREKGALAIYDINRGIATNEEGNIIDLDQDERHISNIIIQEFMILANQAVAEFCAENNIPVLYRNHEAKPSAPSTPNELLLQVQNAIQFPGKVDFETVKKGVNLNLQKARYGRVLKGHYALNLPAYLHFTSPIRRLPDLISHRNIIAYLEGKSFPYSVARLDEIAEHINRIQDEIKDRKNDHFKRVSQKEVAVAVVINDYSKLSESQFSDAIEFAIKSNTFPTTLEAEINERIEKKTLPIKDFLSILLMDKKEDNIFLDIQKAVLIELVKDLPKAISILVMAQQKLDGYSTPDYTTSNPILNTPFTAFVKVQRKNITFTSDSCIATSKKKAEQLAALNLIAKLAGIELGELTLGESATVVTSDAKSEFAFSGIKIQFPWKNIDAVRKDLQDNPKGKLLELVTVNPFLSKLTFETEKVGGGDHCPVFSSVVTVLDNSLKVIEGASSDKLYASNKKDAEQLVAANLLSKIFCETITFSGANPISFITNLTSADTTNISESGVENPKGRLLELVSQRKNWSGFQSVCNRTGGEDHSPLFTASASVIVNGKKITSGDIILKANAKQVERQACEILLSNLTDLGYLTSNNSMPNDLIQRLEQKIKEANYTGALFELCQGLGLNPPQIIEEPKSSSDTTTYEVIVSINYKPEQLFFASITIPNKKAAKNLACKEVLKKAWDVIFPEKRAPFE